MSAASGDRNSRSSGEPAVKRPRLKAPSTRSRRTGTEAVADSITAVVQEATARDGTQNSILNTAPSQPQLGLLDIPPYVPGEPITKSGHRTIRKWHLEAPPITPPASPTLTPIQDASQNRWQAVNTQTSQQAEAADSEGRPHLNQNAALGRAITNEPQTEIAPSTSQAQPRVPALPAPSNADHASTSSATDKQDTVSRSIRQRKSKFTTLATDVDSALRTLYCELETTSVLRGRVSDLESQLSQQRQELNIRQNELLLARKMADMARVSTGEITKLRAEAAGKKAAVEEADALRAEKQTLEKELEASRTQLSIVTQSFQELKKKLSALIGD
ncbi:hypothetical protein G7Z17_g3634 [Cylindrodendrum hubeiense]|uniref:Uncharacterized protein n=1 Tax=Cylindrodendrum hubeiense TaxID=595255 RepID=A0A9P5HIE0_9HYPO|nr:hypothetical protein G7Z17_g3634 [Cylindrodendrum hubeiense]